MRALRRRSDSDARARTTPSGPRTIPTADVEESETEQEPAKQEQEDEDGGRAAVLRGRARRRRRHPVHAAAQGRRRGLHEGLHGPPLRARPGADRDGRRARRHGRGRSRSGRRRRSPLRGRLLHELRPRARRQRRARRGAALRLRRPLRARPRARRRVGDGEGLRGRGRRRLHRHRDERRLPDGPPDPDSDPPRRARRGLGPRLGPGPDRLLRCTSRARSASRSPGSARCSGCRSAISPRRTRRST